MVFRRTVRTFHRTLAPIVLIPFLITAITGVCYRLGKSWFGLSRDQVHFLMVIHEGEYLGKVLEPVYVLLNGLGVLVMIGTGAMMVWSSLKPKPAPNPTPKPDPTPGD